MMPYKIVFQGRYFDLCLLINNLLFEYKNVSFDLSVIELGLNEG